MGPASRGWCRVGELGLMLVELSVVEQGDHAVLELSDGVPGVEVAGALWGVAQGGARLVRC